MIISPRAKKATNVLRMVSGGFVRSHKVLLYRRRGLGSPYRKIVYWQRGINTTEPPKPKLTSFAIVPDMNAAVTKGFYVKEDTFGVSNAWKAFERDVTTSGAFGSVTTVAFPERRLVKGWALQFNTTSTSPSTLAIEGTADNQTWSPMFSSSSVSTYNAGLYGTMTQPMQCVAVRIRTSLATAVRSFQLFDAVPLISTTISSNGSTFIKGSEQESISNQLYQCFKYQNIAYTQGGKTWYANNGSNMGKPSTKDQCRFIIDFGEQKTVCGFTVGGISYAGSTSTAYQSSYYYANCLLIEGRESANDFWKRIDEVGCPPADSQDGNKRKNRYFDFPVNHTVRQLRVTVQRITSGTSTSVTSIYLPPMQVYGT